MNCSHSLNIGFQWMDSLLVIDAVDVAILAECI